MTSKLADTDHPIHPLLSARWSPRSFADKPVSEKAIVSLFEAVRWSPSANNLQPWSFIYGARGSERFSLLSDCLKETNAVWAMKAPVLILALEQPTKPDGTPHPHARYDLGQAVAHMTFQATALGLYSHQMAGFDAERANGLLNVPSTLTPVTMIAVGYLGDPSALSPELQNREMSPRTRKKILEFVMP